MIFVKNYFQHDIWIIHKKYKFKLIINQKFFFDDFNFFNFQPNYFFLYSYTLLKFNCNLSFKSGLIDFTLTFIFGSTKYEHIES